MHPLILGQRLVHLLQENGLTGWSPYPVAVFSKAGRRVGDYFAVTISGRCGSTDLSESGIVLRESRGGWCPYIRGWGFADDFWDGSDFCMQVPDQRGNITARIVVTEKVKKCLAKAGAGNLKFDAIEEYEVSTSVFTIGREYLLPKDFARRVNAAYKAAGVQKPEWLHL